MKKLFLIGLGLLVAGALFAGQVQAQTIVGTAHDLRTFTGGTETQVCIFCHTPHQAKADSLAPLWNHESTAVVSYTLYTSDTLDATPGQPAGTSKACLSCHDGTVAVDNYGTTTTGTHYVTGSALVGASSTLLYDHPISFLYDAALATADTGLVTPASASQVVAGVPLVDGYLECASCHSVHNDTNQPFLRLSNTASALCLTCHLK